MFLTIAPYEWTAPYHRWIVDEMTKTARSRTNLPAAESLHLAHILTEAVRGLLIGGYSDSCQDACLLSGSKKAIFFARLEFQDGKRQTLEQQMRTQFYHGRGTVHVHVLVWLQDAENKARLPEIVAAILPPGKTPLGSLVRGSQLDRQDSSWPLREEPSEWDVQANTLRLRHPQDAFAAHCRAYMPDILSSLKCHMDVQGGDGRGHVLRYTAGYIPKFSAAWPTQIEDADTQHRVQDTVGIPSTGDGDDVAIGLTHVSTVFPHWKYPADRATRAMEVAGVACRDQTLHAMRLACPLHASAALSALERSARQYTQFCEEAVCRKRARDNLGGLRQQMSTSG